MVVRGAGAPVSIAGQQAHALAVSWVGVRGVLESGGDINSVNITPGSDTESGRHYDGPEDSFGPYYTNTSGEVGRQYDGSSLGPGVRVVENKGNERADWQATIYGPCTDPTLTVNDIDISFTGLSLLSNESVVISTLDKTILLNGEPTASAYNLANYTEWTWEDVRLQPGDNTVRYEPSFPVDDASYATLFWRSAWL